MVKQRLIPAATPPLPHVWLSPLPPLDPAQLSPEEQQWCAALPPARRRSYGASRQQLRMRLAAVLQQPPLQVPLHSPPGEAPRLAAGHGFVSLSHSGAQLLLAWSPEPIGVDLEWWKRPLQAEPLARRFFPAEEWQQLRSLQPQEQAEAVLESWVRKEAAIKWCSSGLAEDLRHWFWDRQNNVLVHRARGWRPASVCRLDHGWLCAAVGEAVDRGIWG